MESDKYRRMFDSDFLGRPADENAAELLYGQLCPIRQFCLMRSCLSEWSPLSGCPVGFIYPNRVWVARIDVEVRIKVGVRIKVRVRI